MDENEQMRGALEQLDRMMGFFSRVDSKATFLFALDTGLLALIGLNLHPIDLALWFVGVPGLLAIMLVGASLFFVLRATFPHLTGGERSLIYFKEIASRTEANFIDEYQRAAAPELARDALGQVWRNAAILTVKFRAVNRAFMFTTASLVPWAIFLGESAYLHGQSLVLR